DDTSLDIPIFSNNESSSDSYDYMSEDSSEALMTFLAGRDLQWQFPKQTEKEWPKPELLQLLRVPRKEENILMLGLYALVRSFIMRLVWPVEEVLVKGVLGRLLYSMVNIHFTWYMRTGMHLDVYRKFQLSELSCRACYADSVYVVCASVEREMFRKCICHSLYAISICSLGHYSELRNCTSSLKVKESGRDDLMNDLCCVGYWEHAHRVGGNSREGGADDESSIELVIRSRLESMPSICYSATCTNVFEAATAFIRVVGSHLAKIYARICKETIILSHSVDKMNSHTIDHFVDIIAQLKRSKTYQLLSNTIQSYISTRICKETIILSHSVDKMNSHTIDRFVDIIAQLKRSKTYQLLSNAIQS
ncbi:hypothetical protein Tco_0794230, partial [Tanacetum coccineum]